MTTECVIEDGPHTADGYFETDEGTMCRRHYNQHTDKKKPTREYTHPDKRTPAWKEAQAHKAEYNRQRIINNDRM